MVSSKMSSLAQAAPATIREYFDKVQEVIARLPFADINRIKDHLLRAYHSDRTVFIFGNGGSAATASHMVCDLGKGTAVGTSKRFRVMALTDNIPMITAWANDSSYDQVFAQQLLNFVNPADVVLAISGSGNSPNVINALELARATRAVTLGLTGYQGGKMISCCDVCAVVPSDNMQIIEDIHHSIAHSLFTSLKRELAPKGQAATA